MMEGITQDLRMRAQEVLMECDPETSTADKEDAVMGNLSVTHAQARELVRGIEAEDRHYEELERMCHAHYSTGGHDPYGTSCDLKAGHDGPHQGPEPFGTGKRMQWEGGGMCAGDPLPYRNVQMVEAS